MAVGIPTYRFIMLFITTTPMMFFMWWWTAYPLTLVKFTHEFIDIVKASPPGELLSSRYGLVDWVPTLLLCSNYLYLIMLPLAVLFRRDAPEIGDATVWFTPLIGAITAAIWLIFSVWDWWLSCNGAGAGRYSFCNAYTWCGKFADAVWCPNNMPFLSGSDLDLKINDEFFTLWWSCFVFAVFAYITWSLVGSQLRRNKVLV